MDDFQSFWMVVGDGPSKVRHGSREIAEREAERLASQTPGISFFVMKPVAVFRTGKVERRAFVDSSDRLVRVMEKIVSVTAENSRAGEIARKALRDQEEGGSGRVASSRKAGQGDSGDGGATTSGGGLSSQPDDGIPF